KRPERTGPVEPPGDLVRLDLLDPHHPANVYLAGRGFDPVQLGLKYSVGYCVRARPEFPQVHGRIVIPMIQDGAWVGWQARYCGEADWHHVPKYYNLPGVPKQRYLYNYDRAKAFRLVVAVEGVPAVWALGDAAVALYGKTISDYHIELFHRMAVPPGQAPRSVLFVILLDNDPVPEDPRRARSAALFQLKTSQRLLALKQALGGSGSAVVRVELPEGKDAADFDRAVVWGSIYAQVAAQGIDPAAYWDYDTCKSTRTWPISAAVPLSSPRPLRSFTGNPAS
ncbi:MAG TPA: hypothetical protein VN719_11655, partial [Gemmatimonadales bacterium]|nr:hypothetical protein [Gemmatimonadales bacterium]